VSLTRCSDYSPEKITDAIAAQFELLGGIGEFVRRGDVVLLKPNFIAPKSRRHAVQTDPAVIVEIARLLKDFGAKPFVGDSPAWSDVFTCVERLKLTEPLERLSVPVRQLDKPRKCLVGSRQIRVGISSIVLDADVIINLPKFKTHQQLLTTFALKNMFGCVSGKWKTFWHFTEGKIIEDFCRLLIDIYRFLNPALTIIDGVEVMDGPGPVKGRARNLGWIIGGTDPIACEVVCSRLVNLEPLQVPVIKTAYKIGAGCADFDMVRIVGDNFPVDVCRDFQLPDLIPVRFSLYHVCRSILKQIRLLAEKNGNIAGGLTDKDG
jgi:uncharacterized protein (DUF362 family)